MHTLESVAGNVLCERAMKTLLETYIAQRPPLEWSQLFKEAANVAYMVKCVAPPPALPLPSLVMMMMA